ncbi:MULTISPECIES: cupin domain-containing protein [unclassified Streptomyces]|uniref:cupin domain-containing protein n=1 Tax=unclassified Streptomyces TaxID=2593676 RepID=UPI00136B4032|nr:cupin domain-containing protein [Streptomyces sp. YIM 132580]MXG26510.1 cupin domain-containing protein [Streptomyces sp. YIM 132580]
MTTETARPGTEPILLGDALGSFDALWSPRIMTRVNDYDVRVARALGEHVWHVHENTDEFFLVVEGTLEIDLREGDGQEERTVTLPPGAVFVVPRSTWHRPHSADGASLLLFEPSGTSTVGDAHDPVPDHVDATTGHALTREEGRPDQGLRATPA